MGGFETDVDQPNRQDHLLQTCANGIDVFVNDLKLNNSIQHTLILTFSEFGRRLSQNLAHGIDHGAANNVFF